MTIKNLTATEYNPYFANYINKVSDEISLKEGFKTGEQQVISFFESIPESKQEYRYEKGKWTIKEVLQHLIDTERIFMYRCFRIARRDTTSLAGFDQDVYIEPSKANSKTMEALLNEYKTTRNFSISLLDSFTEDDLKFVGVASGDNMSARAAAFTTLGHEIWHCDIIKERYL